MTSPPQSQADNSLQIDKSINNHHSPISPPTQHQKSQHPKDEHLNTKLKDNNKEMEGLVYDILKDTHKLKLPPSNKSSNYPIFCFVIIITLYSLGMVVSP
jgi:hypothetical protein